MPGLCLTGTRILLDLELRASSWGVFAYFCLFFFIHLTRLFSYFIFVFSGRTNQIMLVSFLF